MDKQELKHKAVLGVIWLGSAKLLSQTISWIFTILVIRILIPDDYGLMALAMAFVGFIQLFNEMGLGAAIIQKQDIITEDLSTVFWFNLIVSCGLYIVTFLTAPLVALFFANQRITILIQVLGLNLILGSLRTIQFNMLIKEMAFAQKSKAELIANLLSGFAALIFARLGFGVWSLVISAMAQNVILTALGTYYYAWKPCWVFQLGRIRELLRFGIDVLGSRLLWYGYGSTDALVVGKILGERLLGFYTIALNLSGKGIDLLSEILLQVCFPVYSSLQNDRQSLQAYFLKLSRLVALIVFPAFTGLILVADDFFAIILSDTWSPAASIFKILCGFAMIRCLAVLIPHLLIATGKANLNLRYSLLCAITMPPAFIAGSVFGVEGVAYAWLLAYPFLFYYALTLVFNTTGLTLSVYLRSLLPAISGTVILASAVTFFQGVVAPGIGVIRLTGSCAIGIVIYLMVIHVAFRGFQEFSFILPALRRYHA